MKNLVFTLLTIFILSPLTILSQEDSVVTEKKAPIEKTSFKHGLGIAAGLTTGYGLSYRFIPKKFGAQIAFAPYKSEFESQYSIGLTFIYKIIESRRASLFIYQGNHLLLKSEEGQIYSQTSGYYDDFGNYIYPTSTITNTTVNTNKINNGIGIGMELKAGEHVGFNFMFGYAGYDAFNTINVTGEFGLFFNFN